MSYFLLSALCEASDMKAALAALREYYGGMLALGATSFWEDFDTEWTKGKVCPIDRVREEGRRTCMATSAGSAMSATAIVSATAGLRGSSPSSCAACSACARRRGTRK